MKAGLAVSLRSLSVRRGDQWVLRDITWQLRPGERWALLGHNGAGKTQLLKLVSGDVWPTPTRASAAAREKAARIYRSGHQTIDLLEAKQRMAYIGGERQDKYARYGWNLPVRDVVATGLHRTDLLLAPIGRAEGKRVSAMLRACRLGRIASRRFLSLSYGEKRLVLLARALVQDPDWLLLDELYNGLDANFRRRIDAVLSAARRRGQSWIATAHRAIDVPRGTGSVIELSDGRIRMIERLKRADHERLKTSAGEQAAQRSSLAKSSSRLGPVLLRLSHVDLYVEYRAVLRDLNWQLRRGEHWSVFGENGAGKSSFLKLLYGDLSPALGGRIERPGFPRGTPIMEWRRRVGYVSPELHSAFSMELDILELVASGRHASIGLNDAATAADLRIARRWLKFFKLSSLAKRRPRELSYGQLRRALIARAMAADAQILLLDEPLTGLDPKQRALMKRLLEHLMRRRVTLVAAVHHAEDLPRGMTHGLHLHKRHARITDSYSAT
jgi:molybdate transport system ATP-binding protein